MAKNFQLVAGHVALDFTNTLDYRHDPKRRVDLLPNYESFIAFSRESGVITARQMQSLLAGTNEADAWCAFQRVIELREVLYFLFLSVVTGQPPKRRWLQKLNCYLAEDRVADVVRWQDGKLVRSLGDVARTSVAPLWPILEAAIDLLISTDAQHVHECEDKKCRWLFLDMSRNHSRRWCDMRICGNRAKARRFYSRARTQA